MPKIYVYEKDKGALVLPVLNKDQEAKELCTIDGKTVVAVSDSVDLPKQDEKIRLTPVDGANYGKDLPCVLQKIEQALPATATINAQVVAKIRERYSVDDEIKMLRTSPSTESSLWNDYVEQCLEWGRREKAKMTLTKTAVAAIVKSVEAAGA